MKKINIILVTWALIIFTIFPAMACTNFLVTKGASADGSTFVSYAADSHVLYGELYHWASSVYKDGEMLKIYEWDTGKYLGEIKQAAKTYNVVGNMNENQVVIGETTYGGLELLDTTAIIDYGSLIYITLQRATSARDAIKIMTTLVAEYGYASEGESFSISDPNDVWILEMIGKGVDLVKSISPTNPDFNKNKGAVWVARMVPDGYVCAHANQARITTFPWDNDPTSISSKNIDKIYDKKITTAYAADVMDFARDKKFINEKVNKTNFSFSDTYAPVNFEGARFCDIRVWAFFNNVSTGMEKYWEYAKGKIGHDPATGYASNRIPLWVKPTNKITLHEVMNNMRNHLEGTELDMSKDPGAGPFGCPYRWRPLTWKVDSTVYCNERAAATQQTGFSFIGQCRSWLPNQIGGIFWFGVDDAASSVYCPMYASITTVPQSMAVGNGNMMTFSTTSAFWAFNQVSNLAYTKYSYIHPEIEVKQQALEEKYITYTSAIDQGALTLIKIDPAIAVSFLTDFSVNTADQLVGEWIEFYQYLFVKYMDGNIKTKREKPDNYKYYTPKLEQPGYSKEWKKHVADETKDKLLVPAGEGH
jgi:dipeptidase